MSNKVLVIEDSESCRLIASRALRSEQIDVTSVPSMREAQDLLKRTDVFFDLILLDFLLPDGDGLGFLDQLSQDPRYANTPVLIWTGREDLATKVSAFSLGAEDFLVKPISPLELRARVEMRLRKLNSKPTTNSATLLDFGDLRLDLSKLNTRVVEAGQEQAVDLTAKEFKILALLAQNPGRIFSRQEIVQEVWGQGTHVVDRTVDSHVCGARKKLGQRGDHIECVAGSGYRFQVKRQTHAFNEPRSGL
jgi:two-component system, OmpR family, phosphate regulon response regulator PhoB